MKPAFRITVAGTDITQKVADRLISLTVKDDAGVKSDRVEITLDDRDQAIAIPPMRAVISVAIGYTDRLVDKGQYTVEEVEIEGPERRMVIRGNATGASKGAGAAKQRSWHETTLGDIARSIAGKHGWEANISPELDSIPIDHIDQHENDLQFLVRLALDNGAGAKVTHNRLVIAPTGEGKTVSGKSLPVIGLSASETAEWNMTLTKRGDYSGVKATYHDLKTGEEGEAIAGKDDDNTHELTNSYPDKASAERAAKSKKDSLQRGKAKFEISKMIGIPEMTAEVRVNATGFRAGVDGIWNLVSVTHKISDGGYSCSASLETPKDQDHGDEEDEDDSESE